VSALDITCSSSCPLCGPPHSLIGYGHFSHNTVTTLTDLLPEKAHYLVILTKL